MAPGPGLQQLLLASIAVASLDYAFWSIYLLPNPICTSVAIFLGLLLFNFLWNAILYPKLVSPLRHLPGPSGGSFLHGQLWRILHDDVGSPMQEWINTIPNNGLIRFTTVFNQERLIVTSPEALHEVLVIKNYDWEKPRQMREGIGRWLGIGVLLAAGEDHKIQRKKLGPAFAYRHIQELYPIFWAKSCQMTEKVRLLIETEQLKTTNANARDAVVPMAGWLSRVTLDIIGIAGVGNDFNSLDNPDTELNKAYYALFDTSGQKNVLAFLETVENFVPVSFLSRLPLKRNKVIDEAARYIRQISREAIKAKKSSHGDRGKDILSVAMASGCFPEENLVDQTMTFLAAGHETTATATSWALVALCRFPEMQKKLRQEILTKIGRIDSTSTTVTPEVMIDLTYLNAFCSEVLRFHAPVPLSRRVCVRDTTILDQRVPKGTNVLLVPAAVNTSTQLWGDDALIFNPERWIGPNKTNSGGATSKYANLSFMHGPRSCIGMSFARAEFACLLAAIVGSFEMEFATPGEKIETEAGITRKLKGDLNLRMKEVVIKAKASH